MLICRGMSVMTKPFPAWLAGGLMVAMITAAAAQTAPGTSVDELLAIARQMSPDLAAMGLDAEAAVARARDLARRQPADP